MPRIAVFGGVYANPYALRALLDDARRRGCDELYCLGDLGGFGAACDAIWPLLLEHERDDDRRQLRRRDRPRRRRLRLRLRRRARQPLRAAHVRLHARAHVGGVRGLDGGAARRAAHDDRRRRRAHGPRLAAGDQRLPLGVAGRRRARAPRARASGAQLLLCTHTGIAWQRAVAGTRIVNVGAIGRPANDGRTEVSYAVLDLADRQIGHVELVGARL